MQVEGKHDSGSMSNITCSNGDNLPADLRNSLDIIARNERYDYYKIFNRTISTEGGNYLGVLHEIDIKGKARGADKETNMFVKCAIQMEHMTIIDISELYAKELFFYIELSKVFTELETEVAVPVEQRFKTVKSYNHSGAKAIILQNVAKEGFGTVYRMDVMPLKFAELSVQELAKFHSLSFIIEKKRPEYFECKIKTIKQSTKFDDDFKKFFKNVYRFAVKDLESERRKKLDNKFAELSKTYPEYLSGHKETVKGLCHGDYKINNILMKLTDGEITEIIPVDYQLIYFGSPMTDFIYFIFCASDQEFRGNHLNHLKDVYYDTMKHYLGYYKIDIDTIYPRKTFDREYEECLDFSLYVTLFILPFFFIHKDEVPDFSRNDILDVQINLDYRYQKRLEGYVDDMIAWGKL